MPKLNRSSAIYNQDIFTVDIGEAQESEVGKGRELTTRHSQLPDMVLDLDLHGIEAQNAQLFRRIRWPAGVICPHCRRGDQGQGSIGFDGWSGFTRKYYCHCCKTYFNDRTGTSMSASMLKMTLWFKAIRLIGAGFSNQSLHHQLGVHPNTAQSLGVRIRQALAEEDLLIFLIHQKLASLASQAPSLGTTPERSNAS